MSSIYNYLENQVTDIGQTTYPQEAVDFASELIDASISSGLTFDIEKSLKSPAFIDFSDIDINTPEGQKLDCIYNKLMQSPSFKNLFENTFGGTQTKLNVKFEIADNLPYEVKGNCQLSTNTINSNITYINTIRINKQSLNGSTSDINIARTILHECIHAYLNIKKINCNLGSTISELNGLDLQTLIGTFYQSFGCHIDLNGSPQSQHVFIFDFMMPTFIDILSSIKDDLISQSHQNSAASSVYYNTITNESESFDWNDFWYYMSLAGLQNTETFQNNIQNDPLKYTKFGFYTGISNMLTKTCN